MRTDNLRANALSPAGFAWYLDYQAALDAKDLARYGTFLVDGCEMRTNNADPVGGKPAVLAALEKY